jgi:hypothetical protein
MQLRIAGYFRTTTATEKKKYNDGNYEYAADTPDNPASYRAFIRTIVRVVIRNDICTVMRTVIRRFSGTVIRSGISRVRIFE